MHHKHTLGTLLLGEDQPVFRRGLRILTHDLVDSILEAQTPNEVLELASAHKPELALVSCDLPGMDKIDLIGKLNECSPKTHVLMLSAAAADYCTPGAGMSGISGYITKKDGPEDIKVALTAAASGKADIRPTLRAWRVPGAVDPGTPDPRRADQWRKRSTQEVQRLQPVRLTSRQRSILLLLTQGRTQRQIGQALGITAHTVNNHLAAVYHKLGVANRQQALLYAIKTGLVPTFSFEPHPRAPRHGYLHSEPSLYPSVGVRSTSYEQPTM